MPFYNSGHGERTLHSILQPRGDIYESGVETPPRRRTRLQERYRQNSRHGHLRDSSCSHARHQSAHTSRHRIGDASAPAYRLRRCRFTGRRKLCHSSWFLRRVIHDKSTCACVCLRLPVASITQKRRDASVDLWPA